MKMPLALAVLLVLAALLVTPPVDAKAPHGSKGYPGPADPGSSMPMTPPPTHPAGQAAPPPNPVVKRDERDVLHLGYGVLLKGIVSDGRVDYAALSDREADLEAYLDTLGKTDPSALDAEAGKALWINAYNAFTLKLILERYPKIQSIKDIPSSKRWDHERWLVGGTNHSLDAIEHEILRPLGDPRIHAAIVCASISCPDLRPEAYLPSTLDEQLDDAMAGFLADTDKGLRYKSEPGLLWGTNHNLYLSSIFDWFSEDFQRHSGSVVDYVRRYAPEGAVAFIDAHRRDLSVEHLSYDWSLNGR